MTIPARFLVRRGPAITWTTNNPILGPGEMGLEIDTRKFKFGDGVLPWTSLDYAGGSGGGGSWGDILGDIVDQTDLVDFVVDTSVDAAADAVGAHVLQSDPHPQYTTAVEAAALAPVQSVQGRTGAVVINKADVGLSLAENKSSATIRSEITYANVTAALGYAAESSGNKNASSGYVGLTGYTINIKDSTGTVTSFVQSLATSARTWSLPDKNGTFAMISDLITDHTSLSNVGTNTHAQIDTALNRLANTSGTNTGDQDLSGLVPKTTTVNGHALTGNISVTKADVGLGSVDNTADADKPVSTAQALADAAVLTTANAYTDSKVVNLWDDRGNYDASGNVFPSSGGSGTAGAVLKGDIWTVSVAGTLGGTVVALGDTVRALVDTPGQTASNWAIAAHGIGYTAENSAHKNAASGYPGLNSSFAVLIKNAAGTITSALGSLATTARAWNMPDKDGTVAMISDVPANTSQLTENTNLYFTTARVLSTALSGLSLVTGGVIAAADTVLQALGKLQKQISDNLATLTSHTGNTSNPHNVTVAQIGAVPTTRTVNSYPLSADITLSAADVGAVASIAPLVIESTNVTAQRNSTNAQQHYLYNTYIDGSNWERCKFGWNSNVMEIGPEASGTGLARALRVFGTYVEVQSGLVKLGGTSSSFPMLKQSGAAILLRKADDSADADLTVGNFTVTGTHNLVPERRHDFIEGTPDVDYMGRAPAGSLTSASVWTIKKMTITADGGTTVITTATGVKWDDRLTATYS